MSATLSGLRFNIAGLIKGFAPGTALQMLHDEAAFACLEHDKYPDDLPAEQRAIVDRDLERTLAEIGKASEAPADKWNAAHASEPLVWPRMIRGDGAGAATCAFYRSDLMANPAARTLWYEQAGIEELKLGTVDPESLEHARRIVERGERHMAFLEPLTAPLDALADAIAAPLEWISEPGTEQCEFFDVWCRAPKVAGLVGGILALAVLGMFPGPPWSRFVGAGGVGAAVWFMGTQRQQGAA